MNKEEPLGDDWKDLCYITALIVLFLGAVKRELAFIYFFLRPAIFIFSETKWNKGKDKKEIKWVKRN